MVCDKCKKKVNGFWIPGKNYPKYDIQETTGVGDIAPIYLCYNCSKSLKSWLDKTPSEPSKKEELLIDMIFEFLCDHSEWELREIVERAIRITS